MYSITYLAPYAREWRVQCFDTKELALSMIEFYQSCGTKALLL